MTATARVVLRGCESYTVNKKTWAKDVPQIVKGEDTIKQYEANGYFWVKRLPSTKPEEKKVESDQQQRKFVKRTLPANPNESGDLSETSDKGEDVNE